MTPLDIDLFIKTIIKAYKTNAAPIITFIANRGATPFELLCSTILSLRTKDQVTAAASARLFEQATTPRQMLTLDKPSIEKLIFPVSFYHTKAERLLSISRILLEKNQGRVPDNLDELLELPGVGRKTANLVLLEGFGIPAICVDTHVHRISNRIGYVNTRTPEETEFSLRKKLPPKHWRKYNELLVAYGQTICKPVSPLCSKCPVVAMCPKIGVTRSR